MNSIICTFFLTSIYLSISSYINYYFDKFKDNQSIFHKNICWSLSLGFIITFTTISSANIIFHLIGFTFKSSLLLLPLSILIFNLSNLKIKKFINIIYLKINNISKNIFKNKDHVLIIFYVLIAIQIFCLFIRFLLPLTHGDAISQYFYDSLQISRLDNLSISQYYDMGEYFRTDSLASFFDAFILQITDNWFLVRSIRVVALILVIFSSIEFASKIGNMTFRKSILLVTVILTLPDIWDSFLSVKHDGYLLLFELTGIYTIAISIFSKFNSIKLFFSLIAIIISSLSIGIRLSSLSLFIISLIFLIYNIYLLQLKFEISKIRNFILSLPPLNLIFFLVIIFSTFTFAIFNYKYYSNPFYWLSPPGILKIFFPNESHILSYEYIKDTLSLRNVPLLIKPIVTFVYSSMGLEPIRFGFNKFKENSTLFLNLSNILNYIGPQEMMVSILSFSPFTLIPYIGLKRLKDIRKEILLTLISIWVLLWSLSIPYTRIGIASSLSLVIFSFSENYTFRNIISNFKTFNLLKSTFIYYGFISIILFTIWSFSYLYDLPLKNLINNDFYSRSNLTRAYLKKQDQIFGVKSIIPDKKFEEDWKKIEEANRGSYIFLTKTPKIYSYFINKGIIISNNEKISQLTIQKKCYQINSDQRIIEQEC